MLNAIGKQFNTHADCYPTLASGIRRAQEELDEAIKGRSLVDVTGELADVVLVIASTCAASGIDLDAHILRKHQVNMDRTWAPHPTIPGAVQHIKENKDAT